ncbi:unnamed protein product [Rotaria sp. Silwood1]|nr:unnamed protein product [Rotaria sp. Silwood1]
MHNRTRSHLSLQKHHISDLLYSTPSGIRSSLQIVSEKAKSDSLHQSNLLTTMSTSQSTSELVEEQKTGDPMTQLKIKSNLQLLREQEMRALQSIKKLNEEEMAHIDPWLSILHKTYEELAYPSLHHVLQATTYFNDELQMWYETTKNEINYDWSIFCDRLKQYSLNRQMSHINSPTVNHLLSKNNDILSFENLIDTKFNKYSGVDDAKDWLLQTMHQFQQCGLRRLEQLQALPFLLVDIAYLWYVENIDLITSFEFFSKLFLQKFAPTSLKTQDILPSDKDKSLIVVTSSSFTSHLHQTIADEIIKKPTYLRGSKDDVHDWLDELEQTF